MNFPWSLQCQNLFWDGPQEEGFLERITHMVHTKREGAENTTYRIAHAPRKKKISSSDQVS